MLACYDNLMQEPVNAFSAQPGRWSGPTCMLKCYRREYNRKVKEVVEKSWIDDSSAPETAGEHADEANSADRPSPPPSDSKHRPDVSTVASPRREASPEMGAAKASHVVVADSNQDA